MSAADDEPEGLAGLYRRINGPGAAVEPDTERLWGQGKRRYAERPIEAVAPGHCASCRRIATVGVVLDSPRGQYLLCRQCWAPGPAAIATPRPPAKKRRR